MFYLRNDGGEFVWKPLEEMRVGARTRPALGDVDGDADVDLVLGTAAGGSTTSNARGKFVNMTGRANPFASVDVAGNHPALVDLDADGRLDLVCGGTDGVATLQPRRRLLLRSDSSDWFASINEGDDSAPSFADFDGDGDADLVLGGNDGALFYYESQGTPVEPRFVNVLESPFLGFAVSSHSRPVAADVDGDGYVDLVVGSSGGATFLKNYDSRFDPNFQDLAGAQSPFSGVTFDLDSNDDREYSKPAVGDLNGDGLPDVVVGTKTGHVIYSFRSTGASAFAAPVPLPGVVVGEHASPALGDLDSDGDLDLVVGQEDGRLLFFRNANVTEFQEEDAFASIAVSKQSAPALVDVNGDGRLDLVVGNYYGTLDFYANLGGEVFEILKDQDSPFRDVQVNYWSSPAFHDLDSDGDVDLLVGESTGKIRYFERRGQSFQERFAEDSPVSSFDVGKFSAPAVADVDGDGDADLVVGQQRGAPSIFANGLCVQENPCSGRGVCETSSLFSESTCSCLIGFAGWQCEACQTGYFGLQDYYFNPFQTYEEAGVIMSCDDRGGLQSTERFADCCVSGERGMDCSVEANNTLEDVRIAPGWWRASIYSTDLYKCGYSGACKDGGWRGLGANASRWKELCADGQEGVMCQVCSSSFHFDVLRNKCVECPGGAVVQGTPLAIFSCALAALLLALATYRCLYDHTDIIFTVAKDLMKDHEAGASDAVIKGGLLFFGSRSHLYDPAAADFDPGGTSSDPGDDAGGVDAPVDPERISIDFSNAAHEERDHADGGDVDEEPSCGALSDDEDEDVRGDSAPTCGGAPSHPDVQPIIMEDDGEDEEEEENEQILRIFSFEFNTRNRKSLLTKLKIVIGVFQIIDALPWSLPMVTLPEAFQTLIEWTSVLELNLVRVLPFDCFMRMDYYRTILIATMTPVFVGLCIFLVGAFYMRRSSNEEDRRSAWIHTMYAFLVLTFLVFPTSADETRSETIGLVKRQAAKLKLRERDESISHLSFLFEEYEPAAISSSSRTSSGSMTSLLVFIYPGSATQIATGLLIALISAKVYSYAAPYIEYSDDAVAELAQTQIVIIFFMCLMIFVTKKMEEQSGQPGDLFQGTVFSMVMVFFGICTVLLTVTAVTLELAGATPRELRDIARKQLKSMTHRISVTTASMRRNHAQVHFSEPEAGEAAATSSAIAESVAEATAALSRICAQAAEERRQEGAVVTVGGVPLETKILLRALRMPKYASAICLESVSASSAAPRPDAPRSSMSTLCDIALLSFKPDFTDASWDADSEARRVTRILVELARLAAASGAGHSAVVNSLCTLGCPEYGPWEVVRRRLDDSAEHLGAAGEEPSWRLAYGLACVDLLATVTARPLGSGPAQVRRRMRLRAELEVAGVQSSLDAIRDASWGIAETPRPTLMGDDSISHMILTPGEVLELSMGVRRASIMAPPDELEAPEGASEDEGSDAGQENAPGKSGGEAVAESPEAVAEPTNADAESPETVAESDQPSAMTSEAIVAEASPEAAADAVLADLAMAIEARPPRQEAQDVAPAQDPDASRAAVVLEAPVLEPAGPKDPRYEKYERMLKMGVPAAAVDAKMRAEGLDPQDMHPKEPVDPRAVRFQRMLRMGVPEAAVALKMRAEGLDPALLRGAPAGAPTAAKSASRAPVDGPKPSVTTKRLFWDPLDDDAVGSSCAPTASALLGTPASDDIDAAGDDIDAVVAAMRAPPAEEDRPIPDSDDDDGWDD
ncbi:hypothetical protein JL722_11763 [Aureococcus anophagefferens]|nr:hypothetical protein JL722_11763 [Aureococcus anophagefferens]